VRNLRKAGVPESVATKISGHKTRAVFERYNIVDAKEVAEAMRRVQADSASSVRVLGRRRAPKTLTA
jgi:hypothetical protein